MSVKIVGHETLDLMQEDDAKAPDDPVPTGHGHFFVAARCHPDLGVAVLYCPVAKALHVTCRTCRAEVMSIAVASELRPTGATCQ